MFLLNIVDQIFGACFNEPLLNHFRTFLQDSIRGLAVNVCLVAIFLTLLKQCCETVDESTGRHILKCRKLWKVISSSTLQRKTEKKNQVDL